MENKGNLQHILNDDKIINDLDNTKLIELQIPKTKDVSTNSTEFTVTKSEDSSNSDFNREDNLSQKSSQEDVNAENKPLNITLDILSIFGLIGFFTMCYQYSGFWEARKEITPLNYQLPNIYDLRFIFIPMIFIVILKLSVERFSKNMMNSLLAPKYRTPKITIEAEGILTKKMCTSLFKLIYYTTIVLLGQVVVRRIDFFPTELFGTGDFLNLFKPHPESNLAPGVPYHLFFNKPDFFNVYYLCSLAFVVIDMFWLLFIYEKQSDFQLMRLHHICTISLVMFSYLTNGSHVGIIVFYLHDLTDILVYFTRICINTAMRDSINFSICGFLLISFIYFRLYIFGYVIYNTFLYLNYWHIFNICLFSFMCILFMMHIYWVYSITKRLCYKKLEDVGKAKKLIDSKQK